MTENQIILEWDRKARSQHGTFTIAIPKQIARKWHIDRGSILTVALLSDGSLKVKLSDDEIDYQRRMEVVS